MLHFVVSVIAFDFKPKLGDLRMLTFIWCSWILVCVDLKFDSKLSVACRFHRIWLLPLNNNTNDGSIWIHFTHIFTPFVLFQMFLQCINECPSTDPYSSFSLLSNLCILRKKYLMYSTRQHFICYVLFILRRKMCSMQQNCDQTEFCI